MIYLINSEYVNQQMKNLELRNDKLETINVRTNDMSYEVGEYVDVDIVSGKTIINNRVDKPLNFLDYFHKGKLSKEQLTEKMSDYVALIENDKYRMILQEMIFSCDDFFVFPAAKSIHHAYIGGLCEHTLNMLDLSKGFLELYDLNKDLLYTGIMLHDFGKVRELKEYGLSYTIEGNLLGHISICNEEIAHIAMNLEINDEPEIYALKHLILSHHGKLDYGSPKEPMLIEAYVLSMLDEMDAKLNLLEKEMAKVEKGKMSPPLMGFDRRRFIKL